MTNLTPFGLLILGVIAIVAIAGLEAYAIYKGIDGALLAIAVGLIAGIAGYIAPLPTKKS